MLPSTSFLVVSGIVNRSPSLWSQGESVRPWQTILESFLWPVSATLNETSRMQLQHCGGESPVAKDRGKKTKVAAINLFPCGLWESQLDTGRQVTGVSCGPRWRHLMKPGQRNVPKHPWPRTKSCSHRFLCLWCEKVNEILADNYREFPVVKQWQSLRKPA